jgi:hypothetical protein
MASVPRRDVEDVWQRMTGDEVKDHNGTNETGA